MALRSLVDVRLPAMAPLLLPRTLTPPPFSIVAPPSPLPSATCIAACLSFPVPPAPFRAHNTITPLRRGHHLPRLSRGRRGITISSTCLAPSSPAFPPSSRLSPSSFVSNFSPSSTSSPHSIIPSASTLSGSIAEAGRASPLASVPPAASSPVTRAASLTSPTPAALVGPRTGISHYTVAAAGPPPGRSVSGSAIRASSVCATSAPPHILKAALEHGSSLALVDPSGGAHTYDALFRAAGAVADILGACGADGAPLSSGSRVGIFSKAGAEFVAALWGTWLAGHVAVPLCTSHPAAELHYVLQNSEASVVVGPGEVRDLLQPIAEQLGIPFVECKAAAELAEGAKDGKKEVLERIQNLQLEGSTKGALFIYTSGTTGRPKGVVHSHSGLAAQAEMLVEAWEYRASDRFLHVLPLHHVHGVMNALLAPLSAGATVDFMPKFSPGSMWARLRQSYPPNAPPAPDAITVFTGVPTHYVRLIEAYDSMSPEEQAASARAASQLRLMMSGSAACPEPVMARWEEITGQRLLERYGMTEFAMGLSNPLHGVRKMGFVGYPLKGVQTKIRQNLPAVADGGGGTVVESVGEGEEGGELLVRSPGMFLEYWKRAEANAEAFDSEGFFLTGDTVTTDADGCFKILGRTSVDIIKSGGYKLSALEIEAVLLEHPKIAECAVVGLPDASYGEVVAAVVAAPEGEAPPELGELKRWCKERMAHYKIPTKLRVIDKLSRNAMGKVNKKELRKEVFEKIPDRKP